MLIKTKLNFFTRSPVPMATAAQSGPSSPLTSLPKPWESALEWLVGGTFITCHLALHKFDFLIMISFIYLFIFIYRFYYHNFLYIFIILILQHFLSDVVSLKDLRALVKTGFCFND